MSELELRDSVCVILELVLDDVEALIVIDTLEVVDAVVDTSGL